MKGEFDAEGILARRDDRAGWYEAGSVERLHSGKASDLFAQDDKFCFERNYKRYRGSSVVIVFVSMMRSSKNPKSCTS